MPRKTRRAKPVKKAKLSWKILFATFTPIILFLFIIVNSSKGGVLGESTSSLGLRGGPSVTPSNCKPMLTAISFSNPCMGKGGVGFNTVTYTCADGSTGSSSKDCLQPQQAFEKAGKTCSKNSKCVKPTERPRPTGEVTKPPRR